MEFCDQIQRHYEYQWSNTAKCRSWGHGPTNQLPQDFCVLEFPPSESRSMWTYATCCMSQPDDESPIEIHLFSNVQEDSHVELLTAIAHYNRTGKRLGLAHTVNFGRPWLPGSNCSFGLLSLPYLDGPKLEVLESSVTPKVVRCLWLVPVTPPEADYAKRFGIEALEQKFEDHGFNYLNPKRQSVV